MFKYKSGEEIELNDVVKHTGLAIVGVALMVSAAAVCGCSEKKPAYTEADVAAAGERVEALMTGFAVKGDVGDVDRLLDALRVAVAGTNELKSTGRLPFLGFLHNVFRANPGRVAGWTARAGEFGDSVVADVLKEAAGFDEEKFLAENAEPNSEGTVPLCGRNKLMFCFC